MQIKKIAVSAAIVAALAIAGCQKDKPAEEKKPAEKEEVKNDSPQLPA